MKFKTRIVMASVAVAMVAVVACGSEDEKPAAAPTPGAIVTPTPASGIPGVTQTGDRGAINSADELSDLFQNTDVTSSRGEEITPAFIGVDGELMTLFGERIEVYVFDSLEDAEAFASGISANGTSIVGPDGSISSVLWIAPPHWYIRGDTILLYVGENLDVIDLLDSIAARRGAGERQGGIVVPPFKMRGTPVPVGGEDEKPAAAPTPGAIVTPTPASGIPGVTQTNDRGAIISADELSDLFQNTDGNASRGDEAYQSFIGFSGEAMTVFGERVEVYVFDSLEDAEAFASGISANGTSIVGPDGSISSVLWIAPPHWYIRGDTIMLYVGKNLDVIDLLDSISYPATHAMTVPLSVEGAR